MHSILTSLNKSNKNRKQTANFETIIVKELDKITSWRDSSTRNKEIESEDAMSKIDQSSDAVNSNSDSSLNDLSYKALRKMMDAKIAACKGRKFVDDKEENARHLAEGLLPLL